MLPQTTADRTLTIGDHTATVATWQRAIARARSEGVRAYHEGDEWYATSVSHKGERHHVNGACDCREAARGLVCKHLAAVLSARISAGELARCNTCGRVGAVGAGIATTLEWLGGHGWIERTHCTDGGCWERWDKAHGLDG